MNRAPSTDRLRVEIDRGRHGDKVIASDPAAAPLGTDDEASNRPPGGEARKQAFHSLAAARIRHSLPDGSGWITLILVAIVAIATGCVMLAFV
jgi:hypothetical protein